MAENDGLSVEMGITLQRLTKQLAAAEARMVRTAKKHERAFVDSNRTAERSFGALDRGIDRTQQRMSGLGRSAQGAGAAIAAAFSVREIQQYADSWTVAGNKIAAAEQVSGRQARSLEAINDIAAETRAELSSTADLYAKLLRSTKDVAESEEQVARATELVNKAFKAGGAAASEQQAGILQLAQGLSSGLLQGDELRSLRENAPLLAQAIADAFGVSIGKLKELGADGELTAERVFGAILRGAPQIEQAFAATNATIGESFTRLRNEITQYIGLGDDGAEATEHLAGALLTVADNLDLVVAAGTILGARFFGPVLGRLLGQAVVNLRTGATALQGMSSGAALAAGSIGALRGSLALLGGPVGLVITAMTTLPLLISGTDERLRDLQGAGDTAAEALERYAEASSRAAGEQQELGGKIRATTRELLSQSREAMQTSLRDLRSEFEATLGDLRGEGLFDASELDRAADLLRFGGGLANEFLATVEQGLREVSAGAGDIAAITAEMQRLAGAGAEVTEAVRQLGIANADPLNVSLEEARDRLVTIAESIGGFEADLEAINLAEDPEQAAAAYQTLSDRMSAAARAGEVLRDSQFETLRQLLQAAGASEKQIGLIEEALVASDEELQDIVARMAEAEGRARGVAGASGSIDFSGAAASASALADQLGRALSNAQGLAQRGAGAAERARIDLEFSDDPIGRAAALARQEFDASVGDLGDADSTVLGVIEQERRAYIASAVEAVKYREELDRVNEARANAEKSGGGGKKKKAEDDQPSILELGEDELEQARRRIEMIGMTDAQVAQLTFTYQMLDEAKRRGIDVDQQLTASGETLRQQIEAQAAALRDLVAEYDQAKAQADFFDQQMSTLKTGLVDAIVEGQKFSDTLADVARSLAKALLQAALFGEGPLATLFGQEAGVGLLSAIPGFDRGGYTGDGGTLEPAGVVHRGEYVFSKKAVQAIGPGALEGLHRRLKRGYASGGLVGGAAAPASGAPAPGVDVHVMPVRSEEESMALWASEGGRRQLVRVMQQEGFVKNGR